MRSLYWYAAEERRIDNLPRCYLLVLCKNIFSKMEIPIAEQTSINKATYITEEDIKLILARYQQTNEDTFIEKYYIRNASDKMLGFLSDYWKLTVHVAPNNKELHFFIKAISRSNPAKADMVRELMLFEKEVYFYTVIKKHMEIQGFKPWSARLVAAFNDEIVFEDLNALQYKSRDKFKRFDMLHTLQALKTLARFHASSIIFEEKKSKELGRVYTVYEEYSQHLDKGGYQSTSPWFIQCMNGAMETIKAFSKYDRTEMALIEGRWRHVWQSGLCLSDNSSKYRNVICHRDLWNNNILFHYKRIEENSVEPDDCLLVDFQAVRYQPPAGDVMLLLCCNLDPKFRELNLDKFLCYYLEELQNILSHYGIELDDITTKQSFVDSAAEQRLWGLIGCACLIPQFWIDDNLTTDIFCNTSQFDEILSKDKASFIKKMMQSNSDYREKVMEIFEEIVERYCLHV